MRAADRATGAARARVREPGGAPGAGRVGAVSPWRSVGPLRFGPRRATAAGAFLVGDAAGTIDPFSGEGMSHALMGAEYLLPHLLSAVEAGRLETRVARAWQRDWNQAFRGVTRRVRGIGGSSNGRVSPHPRCGCCVAPGEDWHRTWSLQPAGAIGVASAARRLVIAGIIAAVVFFAGSRRLWPLVDTPLVVSSAERTERAREFLAQRGFDLNGFSSAGAITVDTEALDYVDTTFGREAAQAHIRDGRWCSTRSG